MEPKRVYNAYKKNKTKTFKSGFDLVCCTTNIMNDDGNYECKRYISRLFVRF